MRASFAERVLLALGAGLLAGLTGLPAGPAAALPVSPVDRELERAREAEDAAASAVEQAESRLAAVSARFDQLMVSSARAAEAHNGAQYALGQARTAESEAVAEAARDAAAAEHATSELGRVAAGAYRTGGRLELISAVLDADRADTFVDGAAVLQTVIRSHNTIADLAMESAVRAENAAERARQARLDREEATRAAQLAARQAAVAVAEFEAQLATLEQEREQALAELAAARGTTIALEEKRQASLALAAADGEQSGAASGSGLDEDQPEAADAPEDNDGQTSGEPATGPELPTGTPAASTPVPAAPSATRAPPEPSATRAPPEPPASREPSPAASSSSPASSAAVSSSTSPPTENPPPPSGAQLAIDYARAQLGKPYEWGAAGPDSFDCSGLTMRAWQRAGVSLPHWSVAQARMVTRVSYAHLRPGDLIFWSDNGQASGTYHVGLYIGAGKMIHAPRPGKVVEIQNVFYWRSPSFYGRV
ncbi:MAG TPA: NlpC/P60 family protein [Jiangellaceae bacterium]